MKFQIRKNVFETNSSTQHTITICSQNTNYSDYIGKTIVLGDFDDDFLWKNSKKDPIVKLNLIWCYMCTMRIGEFIKTFKFIQKTLKSIGINIDIIDDENKYYEYDYDTSGYMYDVVLNEEHPEKLINFIFNKDSWYDSYEDNYGDCPYENEIKEDNETYFERGS